MSSMNNFLKAENARHVFHPMGHAGDLEDNPPMIVRSGHGVRVTDSEGVEMIDAVGGLWNVNLGYSCDPIKVAIREQLEELPYYSTFKGTTNAPLIQLSEKLMSLTRQENMARAFMTSGGSDSIETALRMARHYWKLQGQRDRFKFISFKKGYHGTHFGGASVNGGDRFRRNYEPMLPGCYHVEFPAIYRNSIGSVDLEELTQICLRQIEAEIRFQGPDTVAAFIAEPVLGAGGVFVPHESLWPGLRKLCDDYGVLLIADEVVTGFGRAGDWFGSRVWNTAPDIMCIAKAITSGYFPLGAALFNERVASAFVDDETGEGGVYHGYTYTGHPVGCAAALAALDVTYTKEIEGRKLPENSIVQGDTIRNGLLELQKRVSTIGEVRGLGLMIGVEMVSDQKTKAPATPAMMDVVLQHARNEGVMIRVSGPNIIMSPPLILESADAVKIVEAISAGCEALEKKLPL